jgi:hypothetical protein
LGRSSNLPAEQSRKSRVSERLVFIVPSRVHACRIHITEKQEPEKGWLSEKSRFQSFQEV